MTDEDEKTKVTDKSNDRKYFTVTPRLVWALSEDPFEYTFWCVVKDIAGEDGECILSRDDMAILSMMSGGRASKCRASLMAKKLLTGDFRRDPGYPQKVWHLSIPDFWEANMRWARMYPKLRDRIIFKREQLAAKEPSPDDGLEDPSPHDEGRTPGDEGRTPGDAKKNTERITQKEEQGMDAASLFETIKDILKPNCQRNSFLYLASAQAVGWKDGVLTLSTPSEETRDWLTARMTKPIENIMPGIIQQPAMVVFVAENA